MFHPSWQQGILKKYDIFSIHVCARSTLSGWIADLAVGIYASRNDSGAGLILLSSSYVDARSSTRHCSCV
jgi:hypothetical protein